MTCREAASLLPLFLDGELDPRQMRAVALHGTRCTTCEGELRQLERIQELVSDTVNAAVDEVDFNNFWPTIAAQLGPMRVPRWQRLQVWWSERERPWMIGVPALAAAAAVAILAFLLFANPPQPSTDPDSSHLAAVDNAASIESLDTDVDAVTVMSDPETRTTVLWVSDDSVVNGETP